MRRCQVGFFLIRLLLVFLCGEVLLPDRAAARLVSYGDFMGVDIMYLDVGEQTFDEPDPLFVAPTLLGNKLDFDPLRFFAESNGTPDRTVERQLIMTLMSKSPRTPIGAILVTDGGDFALAGLADAEARASTVTRVEWTILEVGGVPLSSPVDDSTLVPIFPHGGQYSLPDNLDGIWDGRLLVDVFETLQANAITGSATKVEVKITNTLSVQTSAGGSAFIAKKDVGVRVILVPEPASLCLVILAALGGLGFLMRR